MDNIVKRNKHINMIKQKFIVIKTGLQYIGKKNIKNGVFFTGQDFDFNTSQQLKVVRQQIFETISSDLVNIYKTLQ